MSDGNVLDKNGCKSLNPSTLPDALADTLFAYFDPIALHLAAMF